MNRGARNQDEKKPAWGGLERGITISTLFLQPRVSVDGVCDGARPERKSPAQWPGSL